MKFVLDMNISPTWISIFEANGHRATHWSEIGSYSATDKTVKQKLIRFVNFLKS
jgi:predicted nuclease of predicted toxin-antitoxin system